MAVTLDFYSVWYRDHLISFWAKYEQKCFGLTGATKGVFLKGRIYVNGVDSRQGGGGGDRKD